METVKGLSDYTGGVKLVSAVNIPLLTDRAVRLISRGLNKDMKVMLCLKIYYNKDTRLY